MGKWYKNTGTVEKIFHTYGSPIKVAPNETAWIPAPGEPRHPPVSSEGNHDFDQGVLKAVRI